MKDKIRDLLGAGVSQVQVANALGVEESYVSQLMADDRFREEVQTLRAAKATEYIEVDGKIEDLEKMALDKMIKLMPFETNLMKAAKIFQIANGAKKKAEAAVNSQPASTVVNITLPQSTIVNFKMSSDKQVVEVGGRSLVTMPSHVVNQKLKEKQALALLTDATPAIDAATAKKLAQF